MPMNVNKMVDKAYETKTFKELANAPVAALEGISDEKGKLLAEAFGLKTVADLARWKFADWAKAIVTAAETEE